MIANIRKWSLPWVFVVLSFPVFHQGCGSSGVFARSQNQGGILPLDVETTNLLGKVSVDTKKDRLDLMVSDKVYDYDKGQIIRHIPGFDSILEKASVDLLNRDGATGVLMPSQWQTNKNFILLVANSQRSSGAMLEINGRVYFARDFASRLKALSASSLRGVPVYSLSPTPEQGVIPLRKLSLLFLQDAVKRQEVLNVHPECVKRNHPGPKGEYRDGALTIQAVSTDSIIVDPLTQTAAPAADLLWEVTVFGVNGESKCL